MWRNPTQSVSSCRLLWLDVGLSCLLFVLAVAYFSLTFTRTLELRDEGYLLSAGARVAAGEIPHHDFVDIYGPGVSAATGLVLWLFDGSIPPLRIVLALLKAAAVVLSFLISRFLAPRGFAVFGALLAIAYWGRASWNLNTPYGSLYTIPICMLSFFVLIGALLRGATRGYFGAGLIAGTAIMFKQSLGIFNAYGMLLAVCAAGALVGEPTKRPPWVTSLALVLWLLAAVAVLIPFSAVMSLSDYLLHFMPFHLLMALVALAALTRGGVGSLVATFKTHLCPLVVGFAVVPTITTCLYGYWGSLDDLIFNVFVSPGTLVNYYLAVPLPPLSLALFLMGAIALISSLLLAVGGRRTSGVVFGTMASALMGVAVCVVPVGKLETVHDGTIAAYYVAALRLWDLGTVWKAWEFLDGVQPAAISVAALAFFAPCFLRSWEPRQTRELRVVIPLLLFHTMICFQVFPRAGYNCWLLQGALMPLLTVVLFRWYRLGSPAGARLGRKASASIVTALLPLWMVAPIVQRVVRPDEGLTPSKTLNLPATGGITLSDLDVKWNHIDGFEQLVTFLRTETPRDTPVFLVTNEPMILFLSQRTTLFPERAYYLFLLGWDLLPVGQLQGLDADEMVKRLKNTPEAIVVYRPDPSSTRLLAALPELHEFITQNYEVVTRIEWYFVLRQKGK